MQGYTSPASAPALSLPTVFNREELSVRFAAEALATAEASAATAPMPGVAPPAEAALPSRGSAIHGDNCRPCAWFWKAAGCQNAKDCMHCHMCPDGEIKARKKDKHTMMRLGLATPKSDMGKDVCFNMQGSPLVEMEDCLNTMGSDTASATTTPQSEGESAGGSEPRVDRASMSPIKVRFVSWLRPDSDKSETEEERSVDGGKSEPASILRGTRRHKTLPAKLQWSEPAAYVVQVNQQPRAGVRNEGEDSEVDEAEPVRPFSLNPDAPAYQPLAASPLGLSLAAQAAAGEDASGAVPAPLVAAPPGPPGALRLPLAALAAGPPSLGDADAAEGGPAAPPPGLEPPPGTPSHGSLTHGHGNCRPCSWFWKAGGCQNGLDCMHCHLCPEGAIKSRRRSKMAIMRLGLSTPKANKLPGPPGFGTPTSRAAVHALSLAACV